MNSNDSACQLFGAGLLRSRFGEAQEAVAEISFDFARIGITFQQNTPHMMELMTIGYESLTAREFFDVLRRCNVSMIVDVRELPISRKPGFAKAALATGLEKHGIKYRHLVELGCPRDIRHDYRDDGDWSRYSRRFKAYLETQEEAIRQLISLMRDERCCLLCYEEDYNFCHRSYVAENVMSTLDADLRIHHLTGPMSGRVVRRELVVA
jgi:uncharacterized protein YeaO (DUF488 family)